MTKPWLLLPWSLFQNKNNVKIFYILCNLFLNLEASKRREQKLPCVTKDLREGILIQMYRLMILLSIDWHFF